MKKNILSILAFIVLSGSYSMANAESVIVRWTAPGDDGNVGTATTYDLRQSSTLITSANFDQATQVTGLPAPRISGTAEQFTVTGLIPGQYYFAIKTADEAGNWSLISNVVGIVITDTTPPSTIIDLR